MESVLGHLGFRGDSSYIAGIITAPPHCAAGPQTLDDARRRDSCKRWTLHGFPGCSSFWGSESAFCLKFHQIKISFNELKAEREGRDESVQVEGGSPPLPRPVPRLPAGTGDSRAAEGPPRDPERPLAPESDAFPRNLLEITRKPVLRGPFLPLLEHRDPPGVAGRRGARPGRRGEFAERSSFKVGTRGVL